MKIQAVITLDVKMLDIIIPVTKILVTVIRGIITQVILIVDILTWELKIQAIGILVILILETGINHLTILVVSTPKNTKS